MRVKVLQWNVWFKEDIDKVVGVIKDLDVDIVCLQELTQGYVEQTQDNTWEHIQHELGYYGVHQTIPITTDADEWLQANAIFSRYPLHSQREHWLHTPKNIEDREDQFRGYLETVVDIDGTHLTVGTTHMSFQDYEQQHDPELHKLLKATERKVGRYILTGDLNATPDSNRVQELARRFEHAGPSYAENTWTTKAHKTPEFEAATLDWRYDYVFATPDVEVLDSRIIETDVSDHLPVLVTVDVPPEQLDRATG